MRILYASVTKRNKRRMRFFLKFLSVLFLIFFLTSLSFVLILKSLNVPDAKGLSTKPISQTSIIYDRTGNHILYEIYGEENRKIVSHDQIPDTIRICTVAAEDKYFYEHHGIDFRAIARALKTNIESKEIRQGGSTITQQLARNVFLTPKKSLKRKAMEAILAIEIERKYTKDEILDKYLNTVPYGSNAYGIESASQIFFGKPAKDLTLDEAALLAALPKAPTAYSPYKGERKELLKRQKNILERVGQLGLASNEEMEKALKEDTYAKIIPFKNSIDSPHFVFYVKEQLEKKYGKEFLEKGGLRIYTTLDYDLQQKAENVVAQGTARNTKYGATNASLVAIDPKSGEILAMVGSKDYFNTDNFDGQFNVATHPRQPGSAFKPFAYAAAFEKGYQPETLLLDVPVNFGKDGSGKSYVPHNYDGRYHGVVSMREALAQSLNIPAVETLYITGIDPTIQMAHRLGVTSLNERNRYGLALVLGGAEVSLLDMSASYSVFANDGKRNEAHGVMKIIDGNGQIYMQAQKKETQVINPEIARKINSILSDNHSRSPIFGSHSPLYIPQKIVAAKTGTTQEYKDGWTIGYTPSITVGVWVGNNDNKPMKPGSDGVFVAAPIWRSFMDQIADRLPTNEEFSSYQLVAAERRYIIPEKIENEIYYSRSRNTQPENEDHHKHKRQEERQPDYFTLK